MTKLYTPVNEPKLELTLSLGDKIMILGSCFADEMGLKMKAAGFDVCINPFGTLYNPSSIASSIERLNSGKQFTKDECVPMGAGAGKICSWWHHTSFAKESASDFLLGANASLAEASSFWKECNKLIITLGTAMVWELNGSGSYGTKGQIVSNCLKRPSGEFTHRMLSLDECKNCLESIQNLASGKDIIFTVSPIRHLSQGAHQNSLSKARLHLAIEALPVIPDTVIPDPVRGSQPRVCHFPAYEILLDELRDYRFYAEDLVHPSKTAIEIIWERFLNAAVPEDEHERIQENLREHKRKAHRQILQEA